MTLSTDWSTTVSSESSVHLLSQVCTVHKLYAYFVRSTITVCRFRPLGGIANPMQRRRSIVRPLFPIEFNTLYLSNRRHLKVTSNFCIVDYGGMSISIARGRLRLEMRSPVDTATKVFNSCFVDSNVYLLPFLCYERSAFLSTARGAC
jgi:hypothetical protein